MTEPKKLTPEELEGYLYSVRAAFMNAVAIALRSHIAAQEQERNYWKEAFEASDLKRWRSGVSEQGLFNRLMEVKVERDAAIARAEVAEAALTEWRGSVMSQAMQQRNEANFERDVLRDRVKVLEEALDEILDYQGGADNALEDEYVMERARAALSTATEVAKPCSE